MNMNTLGSSEVDSFSASETSELDPRLLVVGEDTESRRELTDLLSKYGYSCSIVGDAAEARTRLELDDFAVVLTDTDLPGMSGLEFVTEVATDHPECAVFILTGLDDPGLVSNALEMGAYGYMVKPFQPHEVLINVANALRRRSLEMENRRQKQELQGLLRGKSEDLRSAVSRLERVEAELRNSREETIERLSIAAEFRDNETMKHIKRVSGYSQILARGVGHDQEHCEMIRIASQLHDVGKIGIPDIILMKKGPLTEQERKIMQQHTEIGYRILSGSNSEVLSIASSIALTHHERFDGGGYPRGLAGDSIPVEGRIMAVADMFDGLTAKRVYKDPVPVEHALELMKSESDKQLDADLVDLFLSSMEYVLPIKEQYKDGE
jgi:putative two-component system response regulator